MENPSFWQDLFIPGISWAEKIIRPLVIYAFLVVILRVGGRRELGQMNAFDLVVLLTLSNTVQNAIIGNDNSLLGGIVGATTLILTNMVVVRYLYRHRTVDRTIEGEPVSLIEDGQILRENLQRELITEDELLAALRRQGLLDASECERAVLETSGTISVIARRPTPVEATGSDVMARLDRIEALLARLAAQT